ncbi:MAG: sigma-70 family RNA polymerase sigma factor [Mucilaginibacter polytrichastri]|nr:sigma-70 family RNA polymerase sigma factor [Mucilaginibacter polytrichastri]
MSFLRKHSGRDERPDADLVAEYRSDGELGVLSELYQRYMELVYGVCLKYLNDEEEARDAVMGIFEELIEKVRTHEVSQFRGWLYVVARNYCLMHIRREKKMPTVPIEDHDMETGETLHPEREENLQALERCMRTLPEQQKQTVDLFYLQQKCYKDIADITGYDMNKVKSYIQNGKRNLKICLEKNQR